MEVPGTYILVDHSIFRTFHKGALGMLKAEGPAAPSIYSGREVDETYLAEKSHEAQEAIGKAGTAQTPEARMQRGKAVFLGTCSTCHQLQGQGLASIFPPLAKSDYLMADAERSINVVLKGLSGPLEVNGQKYNNTMPPLANLTDHEIADVLTYVRNSFGNKGDAITAEQVAAARAAIPKDTNGGHP